MVNGVAGRLFWGWTDDMKSVSLAAQLQSWGAKGVNVVVWDRARGHYGTAYEDVQVKRVYQPPYSPELNPTERVFAYLRSRIEGRVYDSLEAKKAAIEAELEALANDPERIRRLAGWDWIREAVVNATEK